MLGTCWLHVNVTAFQSMAAIRIGQVLRRQCERVVGNTGSYGKLFNHNAGTNLVQEMRITVGRCCVHRDALMLWELKERTSASRQPQE